MGFLDSIFAIIALALGLIIAVSMVWWMVNPLLSMMRGRSSSGGLSSSVSTSSSKGKMQNRRSPAFIRREEKRLTRVDALIASGNAQKALKQLRKSVILKTPLKAQALEGLKEHHQNVLSRCLSIAEEIGSKAENIAEAEHLLMQRIELHQLLIDAQDSFHKLKYRREKAGKNMPSWGKSDFEQRLVQIKKEIEENEKKTTTAVDDLFRLLSIPNEKKEDDIVYH